jgi:hypothetical protein
MKVIATIDSVEWTALLQFKQHRFEGSKISMHI